MRAFLVCLLGLMILASTATSFAAPPGEAPYKALLQSSWEQYRQTFIQADGRVIDRNGNVTTSEGQSYAMLRALWTRDQVTFDRVWQWTANNLQRRPDKLFAWKWGQKPDGTWGILDNVSASDADQDIALALLLASHVWQNPAYKESAMAVLDDLWNVLTVETPIGRVLLPGDWPANAHGKNGYQINPSYFAGYAYRVFAEVDPNHDWTLLTDSSYEILQRSMGKTFTHLPPDWLEVSRQNDDIALFEAAKDVRSDYGYEAIRVFWRLAMDNLLDPLDKRSAQLLAMPNPLPRYFEIHQSLPGSLTWDGIPRQLELVSAAPLGATLPSLYQQNRTLAKTVIDTQIVPNLKPGGRWNTPRDYYTQNWLWFGLAWYHTTTDGRVVTGRALLPKLANYMKL